jgi:uncharacterized protein YgiM (DUF1202 family)
MKRAVFVLVGVLVLSLAAFGLAEATMVFGHQGVLTDDSSVRPSTSPKAKPAPTSTPIQTATPTPTPTTTPDPVVPTASAISFVHMRAGASTATPIVIDLYGGEVLRLGAYSDSQWQQVSYNGHSGYVFKAYLRY